MRKDHRVQDYRKPVTAMSCCLWAFINLTAAVKVENQRWGNWTVCQLWAPNSLLWASERFYEIWGVGTLALDNWKCIHCIPLRPMALLPRPERDTETSTHRERDTETDLQGCICRTAVPAPRICQPDSVLLPIYTRCTIKHTYMVQHE